MCILKAITDCKVLFAVRKFMNQFNCLLNGVSHPHSFRKFFMTHYHVLKTAGLNFLSWYGTPFNINDVDNSTLHDLIDPFRYKVMYPFNWEFLIDKLLYWENSFKIYDSTQFSKKNKHYIQFSGFTFAYNMIAH